MHTPGQQGALLEIAELTVYPGERIVVTGPSGSGKSLLLATLTGRWAAGLTFTGHRTAHFSRLGFIPQRGLDALHPLTTLQRQLRTVSRQPRSQVDQALNSVGLTDPGLRRRRPTELSGGQAQRAAIALAVLTRAPLLLADEPTSALDHDSRDQTLRLLNDVVDQQQTLVVVTHDEVAAQALATRHLKIIDGRLRELPPHQKPGPTGNRCSCSDTRSNRLPNPAAEHAQPVNAPNRSSTVSFC